MKLQACLFVAIMFLLCSACHTPKSSSTDDLTVSQQLTVLLEQSSIPQALAKEFPELKTKARTNRTLNEWLFEYTTNTSKEADLIMRIKNSSHVVRVDLHQ